MSNKYADAVSALEKQVKQRRQVDEMLSDKARLSDK